MAIASSIGAEGGSFCRCFDGSSLGASPRTGLGFFNDGSIGGLLLKRLNGDGDAWGKVHGFKERGKGNFERLGRFSKV